MSEQLLASLKSSQHKVITTAIDEHTGKKYELLAVQMEREAVEALIGELQQLTWACKAQPTAVVPSDCNHPFCGCDPHAERIIKALQECGWGPDHDTLRARVAELEELKTAHEIAMEVVVEENRELRALVFKLHKLRDGIKE